MTTSVVRSQPTSTSVPEDFRTPPWWNKRTTLERKLCLVTAISLLMISVMVAALAVFGYLYQKNIDSRQTMSFTSYNEGLVSSSSIQNLCLTPGCIKAAADILSNIDENEDPCNDFYKFSCDGWRNRHMIPEDKTFMSSFMVLDEDLFLKLKVLLEKKLSGTEPSFIRMVKDMYDTCMDLESIENSSSEPLKEVLETLGGWPVVEGRKWNDSNFDWIQTLKAFRELGYNHNILLRLSVAPDKRNNTVHIITLDQTDLGMPDRSYLVRGLNDSSTAAYYNQMVKSAKLLGADEKTVENELLKALQFEMALANISLPHEERRNVSKLYNEYTVQKLQEIVPQIPWLEYFNGLLNDEIHENEILIVAVPEFLKNFGELITQTEKRVVANYMMWRVVGESLSILSKEWRDIDLEYESVLNGKKQEEPRWEQCLNSLVELNLGTTRLGIAVSSYYVQHYFTEELKNAATELVKYIQQEFLNILDDNDWMDEETKKQAKAKANNIEPYIGYPKELLNHTVVMKHYENLTITNDSFFQNIRRLRKWSTDYTFSQLRKPNIRREWKNHANAAVVNAFYGRLENSIDFPAGILQNPFFNKDRPKYINFGTLGHIAGHEITHGFDDGGRQYDKDGNNINWWQETTNEFFEKKAQCIIDQYSNYTTEIGMNVNGINTQGENIADNGGVKEAYWAYQSWVKNNGPEQLLPGVKYTQNQLFWISVANVWCTNFRPEKLKLQVLTGAHSPARFRVIGSMSNLPEFSKDFNCSPDSPMNKKPKCQVW